MEDLSSYVEEQTNSNANSGVDALWSRAIEHTIKIALICACSDTAQPATTGYRIQSRLVGDFMGYRGLP